MMVAAALFALLPALPAAFAASGIVLGMAYGPMNPASTVLLARYTPPQPLAGLVTPPAAAVLGWRGAIAALGILCLTLSALIQPWRKAIDEDGGSHDRDLSAKFWLAVRLIIESPGIRAVSVAAFAFGALQFSFVAVFPTVLAHIRWSTAAAGLAMSVALVVGVVLRVPWGALADKIGSRPILAAMGAMLTLASLAACFLNAAWSGLDVTLLAALFGVSAFCWSGIGIAEAVRHVPPALFARGQRRDHRHHVLRRAGRVDALQHRRRARRDASAGLCDPRRARGARHRAAASAALVDMVIPLRWALPAGRELSA